MQSKWCFISKKVSSSDNNTQSCRSDFFGDNQHFKIFGGQLSVLENAPSLAPKMSIFT